MCPNTTTPATKCCTRCKIEKPLSEFSLDKRNKRDGHQSQCKACNRAYHYANRERILEKMRSYLPGRRGEYNSKRYYARRDRNLEHSRAYQHMNQEKISRRKRSQYAANPQKTQERARHWREKNPEVTRARYRVYTQRRRKAMGDNGGSYTVSDILALYDSQRGRCHYCGVDVGSQYDVDHVIPLSRGGSNNPDNLVIACPPCNRSKSNKLPDEWAMTRYSSTSN